MVVIAFASANCAFVRNFAHLGIDDLLVFMPMLNILGFGLTRCNRGRAARHFWAGFEAAGCSTLGLLMYLAYFRGDLVSAPLNWISNLPWVSVGGWVATIVFCAATVLIYTTPQIIASAAVGWFWARYRLVIERRMIQGLLPVRNEI